MLVLPDVFRGMKAQKNSAETQQSDLTQSVFDLSYSPYLFNFLELKLVWFAYTETVEYLYTAVTLNVLCSRLKLISALLRFDNNISFKESLQRRRVVGNTELGFIVLA